MSDQINYSKGALMKKILNEDTLPDEPVKVGNKVKRENENGKWVSGEVVKVAPEKVHVKYGSKTVEHHPDDFDSVHPAYGGRADSKKGFKHYTYHSNDGINLNVQINNGTVHQVAFSTATAGTAQFTIGKDNSAASNFFAGWLYEKVYTKDNVPSSAQIADTKAYVANIAGITL